MQQQLNNLKILGFDHKPNKEELKKRWRQLAKRFHPDRLSKLDIEERQRREEKFKEISRAYQELNDCNTNTINLQDTFSEMIDKLLQDLFMPNILFDDTVQCMLVTYQSPKYQFSLNKATEELEVYVNEPLESFIEHKKKIYTIRHNNIDKDIKVTLNTHNYSVGTMLLMTNKGQYIDTIVDESYPIYTILYIGLKIE